MRSFEDKWDWLRSELSADVDVVDGKADRGDNYLHGKSSGLWHALDLMDQADRNGPVEPL